MTEHGVWAEQFLRRIARPRGAGTEAVADVQQVVTDHLTSLGYHVSTQEFETTARRLMSVSMLGAGCGWTSLLLVPGLIMPMPGWLVSGTGILLLFVVTLVTWGIAEGHLPDRGIVVKDRNVIATKPGQTPDYWLVCHSDSKGQGLSMAARVVATIGLGTGLMALVGILGLRLFGPLSVGVMLPPIVLVLAAGALLSRTPFRDDSPGAVDNASGIVAALVAAANAPNAGVLVTGAEEYGMVGARVWDMDDAHDKVFVNFDGIDDGGSFNVMRHGDRRKSTDVERKVVAALNAPEGSATVREAALPFGIFVDGGVLASRGMSGVTISCGTWGTLRVIHTRRDVPDRLKGHRAVAAGLAVAAVLGQEVR